MTYYLFDLLFNTIVLIIQDYLVNFIAYINLVSICKLKQKKT